MKSYQITEWGGPLELSEKPTPTPEGREVLLRITAAGICHSDLHIQDGFFDLGQGERVEFAKLGAQLPLTLGHEIAGVVEAVGPDAGGVTVGQAYIAFPWIGCRTCGICEHEREQFCMSPKFLGARVDGGYSDHVIVPDPSYLVSHDGIPADLACTYACAGLTAYSALRKAQDLGEADCLLMIGAGGVGLSALHMAKELTSAKVVVADVDPEKRAVAKAAGAFEVIDNSEDDAVKKVLELTGGGVRVAIDFVGAAPTGKFGLASLRKGGKLIVVGLYGGALPVALPLMPVRALTIQGSYVGTLDELKDLVRLGQAGMISPIPLDPRSLDDAPRSLQDLRDGKVSGRVILRP
ncbi:MAG: alcohol dehydrogenase [Alphaproteobacteria bacterium]|nr:alcohol dehydrogenase [Alphaproteobacteria bacterium]